jgi:hypothetical protein
MTEQENVSTGRAETQPALPLGLEAGLAPTVPHPSSFTPQPSASPAFPRCPGETPRAFSAFLAFFQLGHGRCLQAVADHLGEKHDTVKAWSSKYRWSERIQSYHSGLLQQQAEAEAAARRQQAADWSARTSAYREQEWATAQKLLTAAQCYLESFGDREVEKMTLAQVSRALQISSRIARQALRGASGPEEPTLAPLQIELAAALKRAYAQPPAPGSGVDEPKTANPATAANP